LVIGYAMRGEPATAGTGFSYRIRDDMRTMPALGSLPAASHNEFEQNGAIGAPS
jgi:formyltetrahydrofolate synthetase